ncbi:MAG TPA: hypothetical protein DIV86_00470 [Alphaproteobacteria bacterium]|nr:hypothetical protein [Alphaproteobacteria bacterium]
MKKVFCIILLLFSTNSFAQHFTTNDKNIKVQFGGQNKTEGSNIIYQKQAPAQNIPSPIKEGSAGQKIYQLSDEQLLLSQKIKEKPEIKTDCDRGNEVCLISNVFKDRIVVELENRTFATRTIKIKTYFQNVKSLTSIGNNYELTLASKERKLIDTIIQVDPTLSYGYKYDYTSYMGKKDAVHDDSYIYDLPFEYGKSYKLLQSYGGKFSHSGPENYYSYDFRMNTGTPVTAARDGRVIIVKENFTQGGPHKAYEFRANRIYVEHSDGTIGIYTHLAKNGAIVKVGDYVQKGQHIGYSGNTGFSDIPHLHFNVSKIIREQNFRSLPIKIRTSNGIERQLKVGVYYGK